MDELGLSYCCNRIRTEVKISSDPFRLVADDVLFAEVFSFDESIIQLRSLDYIRGTIIQKMNRQITIDLIGFFTL